MASERDEKICLGACGCAFLISFIIFCVCMGSYAYLGPDEQVLIKTAKGHRVVNGVTSGQLNPFQEKTWRKATLIDDLQYAIVQDRMTAKVYTIAGPKLYFLGAYEDMKGVAQKLVIQLDEYVRLVDSRTGLERVHRGPATVVPNATELTPEGVRKAVYLDTNTAVVMRDKTTGMMNLVTQCTHNEGIFIPKPLQEIVEIRRLTQVLPFQSMVVRDVTGVLQVFSGADGTAKDDPYQDCFHEVIPAGKGTAFFLPAYSKIVRMRWSDFSNSGDSNPQRRLSPPRNLREDKGDGKRVPVYQYVHDDRQDRIYTQDGGAGSLGWTHPVVAFNAFRQSTFDSVPIFQFHDPNTHSHEYTQRMWPKPGWRAQGVAFHAYAKRLNGAGAVYEYYNTESSAYLYRLGREHPGPEWVLTNTNGNGIAFYAFQRVLERRMQEYPEATDSSLYVDQSAPSQTPGAATGPKIYVTAIDHRTQKSFYTYTVRTTDNVKMEIGGPIFWKVVNVTRMVKMTSDPAGDVFARCRSTMNAVISNMTMIKFMNSLREVTTAALDKATTDDFYPKRGLEVVNLDLTKYTPVDAHTRKVLQQIIRQTVIRMNDLEKQESANDIAKVKLTNDIHLEGNRTDLIEVKAKNQRIVSESAGNVSGTKAAAEIRAFMDGLNETLPYLDQRLDLLTRQLNMESQNKDSKELATGDAAVYVSPDNFDLRLVMPKKDK